MISTDRSDSNPTAISQHIDRDLLLGLLRRMHLIRSLEDTVKDWFTQNMCEAGHLKAGGLCGGKGGSTHLTDVRVGAVGSFATRIDWRMRGCRRLAASPTPRRLVGY